MAQIYNNIDEHGQTFITNKHSSDARLLLCVSAPKTPYIFRNWN